MDFVVTERKVILHLGKRQCKGDGEYQGKAESKMTFILQIMHI